ncbi:MAG TPA: hypothetical protein VGE69_05675 [Pseudomonadales bacterium]
MRSLVSCCVLVLLAATVHAAEPGETDTEAEAAESAEDEREASGDIDSAVDEEIRAAEEAAADAPPAATDEAFVPSVQISEDLSVSFPVDI